MSSVSTPPSKAQQLGRQVWRLPHVRLSVFNYLIQEYDIENCREVEHCRAADKRLFLKPYLLIEKESFREVAFLLYPYICLDQFPLNSKCEERRRLYAAGVRSIDTRGCFMACAMWDNFAAMLEFFPNATGVTFQRTGISFYRKSRTPGTSEHSCSEFHISQEVIAEDGSFCSPVEWLPPEDLQFQTLYKLTSDTGSSVAHPISFEHNSDGQPILPDVLRLPVWELDANGPCPTNADCLKILRLRKSAGLSVRSIHWTVHSFQELEELLDVAGEGLHHLHLLFSADDVELISPAADAVMNLLEERRVPDLRHLYLWVDFPGFGEPELPDDCRHFPRWLYHSMPPHLSLVELQMVLHGDMVDPETLDGPVPEDFEDLESEPAQRQMAELVYECSTPIEWIHNMRRKFGDSILLTVESMFAVGELDVKEYRPDEGTFLDDAMYGSMPEDHTDSELGSDWDSDADSFISSSFGSTSNQPDGGDGSPSNPV